MHQTLDQCGQGVGCVVVGHNNAVQTLQRTTLALSHLSYVLLIGIKVYRSSVRISGGDHSRRQANDEAARVMKSADWNTVRE